MSIVLNPILIRLYPPYKLQASDNVVYVNAYTRDDGTEVRAHWRSKPDGIESNNLGFNTSNKSGIPIGGASEIEDVNLDEEEMYEDESDEHMIDVSE